MASKQKGPTLADMIRADVGGASIAAMGVANGERTIETITAEILHYQAVGGDAVIQIGQRLIEAKAAIPHGGWLPWLSEQVHYSERTAQRLMKIARDCSNPTALSDLGATKALALLALPVDEREAFVEAYDIPNMSTRELDDAIKRQKELELERDEARTEARKAREFADKALEDRTTAHNEMLRAQQNLEDANARIKALESAPKEVFQDEAAIKKAAEDARAAAEAEWSAKVKAAEEKLAKAEAKAKKAAAQSENAGAQSDAKISALKAEADRLRQELEAAKREQTKASISGDADLAAFRLLLEQAQEIVNKMLGLLLKVRGREDTAPGEKLTAALVAFADKVKECAK